MSWITNDTIFEVFDLNSNHKMAEIHLGLCAIQQRKMAYINSFFCKYTSANALKMKMFWTFKLFSIF